jgi:HD-GYP domain-containing protein (c-di-GMP phosphodiesterase class II)
LQHHERYDGLGYPQGLRGNQISLEAKILAITDAFDAMTTKREFKDALSVEEAIYELRANKGKQFDPEITELFIEILNKKNI